MAAVRKYRKRPIEVEAIQFTGHNDAEVAEFLGEFGNDPDARYPSWIVETLHGQAEARVGDWVVKGPQGDFWPVQPEIFEDSYEDPDLYVRRQMVGEPSCGDPECPCQRKEER